MNWMPAQSSVRLKASVSTLAAQTTTRRPAGGSINSSTSTRMWPRDAATSAELSMMPQSIAPRTSSSAQNRDSFST